MFIQAKTFFDAKDFPNSFNDSMATTRLWIRGNRFKRCKNSIDNAYSALLNIKSKNELDNLSKDRDFDFAKTIKYLKESPQYNLIEETVEKIEKHYAALK